MSHPTEDFVPLPPRPWWQSLLWGLGLVALLLGGAWGYARWQSPHPFYGAVVNSPSTVRIFSGVDGHGQPWTLRPEGKQTIIFFGFTRCPAICPLTLSLLNEAKKRLDPELRDQLEIVFVSVDPERDSPERIQEYIEFFGDGTGVRVPPEELPSVAADYNVVYGRVPVEGPLEYQINHTTASYMIDSSGFMRVMWDYTQLSDPDRIATDIAYVMQHPKRPQGGTP